MTFKSTFYNIANITLSIMGLSLFGCAIFLFANGLNTVNQGIFLAACYYTISGLFGLATHRWSKCTWYKYHSWNMVLVVGSFVFTIITLGFFYNDVQHYLSMVDGGKDFYVNETMKFIKNSRIPFLTIGSISVIVHIFHSLIALGFHKAAYKQYITDEFKRVHNIADTNNEVPDLSKEKPKGKMSSTYQTANEPLIVSVS